MFAETTVEAKRKVRSRRNAKVSQQDRKQEQQEAAYAQGYYVEGGTFREPPETLRSSALRRDL